MLINGDSGETFNLFVKFFAQHQPHGLIRTLHQRHRHFLQQAPKKTPPFLKRNPAQPGRSNI
jgi:hypothetical protein